MTRKSRKYATRNAKFFSLTILLSALIYSGCDRREIVPDEPAFSDYYATSIDTPGTQISKPTELPAISITAKDMPLRAFLKIIMDSNDISVICDEGLEERRITLAVNGIRADRVMELIARRLNVAVTRTGNIYYLGASKPEDKAVYITKCTRLDTASTKAAVEIMLSQDGKSLALEDGLLIVADKTEILGRVASFVEDIKNAPADTWVIQYQIISYSQSAQKELGLNTASNFALAAGSAEANGDISAALTAAVTSGKARLLSQPLQLIEDGTQATLKDGTTTPVPRKTVSDSGTVTTTGVDYIESGLEIKSYIRDMGNGYARLKVTIESTAVSGYVDSYPITKGQKTTFQTAIKSGQPYLVANLTEDSESRNSSLSLYRKMTALKEAAGIGSTSASTATASKTDKKANSLTQIWARAYKIGGLK